MSASEAYQQSEPFSLPTTASKTISFPNTSTQQPSNSAAKRRGPPPLKRISTLASAKLQKSTHRRPVGRIDYRQGIEGEFVSSENGISARNGEERAGDEATMDGDGKNPSRTPAREGGVYVVMIKQEVDINGQTGEEGEWVVHGNGGVVVDGSFSSHSMEQNEEGVVEVKQDHDCEETMHGSEERGEGVRGKAVEGEEGKDGQERKAKKDGKKGKERKEGKEVKGIKKKHKGDREKKRRQEEKEQDKQKGGKNAEGEKARKKKQKELEKGEGEGWAPYAEGVSNAQMEGNISPSNEANMAVYFNHESTKQSTKKRKASEEHTQPAKKKRQLKQHPCTHPGCDYATDVSTNLARHMAVHTGIKLFACTYEGCGKSYTQSVSLERHFRTHTGEKPFVCSHEGCGRAFGQHAVYYKHLRTHTGERPYPCTFPGCGKRFPRKDVLVNHARQHTGEKPFSCFRCFKTFADAGNRFYHVNKGCPLIGIIEKSNEHT